MNLPLLAGISLFAFGALFAGTLLLLLLNPGSRSIRWWVAFQTANMVWLAGQGWAFATDSWGQVEPVVSAAVHLMPALFVAFTLVDFPGRSWWWSWAAVALGAVTLPLDVASIDRPFVEGFIGVWHLAGWGLGTWLLVRSRFRAPTPAGVNRRLARVVVVLLLVMAPISLVGTLVFGGRVWGIMVMPVVVVLIQLLIFVGVARLRFYDIEVRLARTGELASEAVERERLAVVGELAASLAHEIRNPLTGVRSLAQRLAEDDVDEERRRRYGGVILEEVGRVERLVANLLGVARRPGGALSRGPTELAPLFADLELLVSSRAARAGVQLATSAGSAVAASPREPLVQVLLNLLLNAIAQSPAGSRVEMSAVTRDGALSLCVRDRGPGVPAGERERIWEAFYSSTGGTGLGLAVVWRLAREHGWAVEVGDAAGGGAEFRITLPAAAAREVERPEPAVAR